MASETPPLGPAPGNLPEEDEFDFEFDPADELEPGNEFLDSALTRAGEFTLDLIEAVQEHPVLTASLFAAGFGAIVGLIAGSLVRRQPSTGEVLAATAVRVTDAIDEAGLAKRVGSVQRRLGATIDTAGASLRDNRWLRDHPWRDIPRRATEELSDAAAAVEQSSAERAQSATQAAGGALRRVSAASHLVPIALELLRNEIVRDLVAHALASRLRRGANL